MSHSNVLSMQFRVSISPCEPTLESKDDLDLRHTRQNKHSSLGQATIDDCKTLPLQLNHPLAGHTTILARRQLRSKSGVVMIQASIGCPGTGASACRRCSVRWAAVPNVIFQDCESKCPRARVLLQQCSPGGCMGVNNDSHAQFGPGIRPFRGRRLGVFS